MYLLLQEISPSSEIRKLLREMNDLFFRSHEVIHTFFYILISIPGFFSFIVENAQLGGFCWNNLLLLVASLESTAEATVSMKDEDPECV